MFRSGDDVEVVRHEVVHQHLALADVEERRVVGPGDDVDRINRASPRDVDGLGGGDDRELGVVDDESCPKVRSFGYGLQQDAQGSAMVRRLPGS